MDIGQGGKARRKLSGGSISFPGTNNPYPKDCNMPCRLAQENVKNKGNRSSQQNHVTESLAVPISCCSYLSSLQFPTSNFSTQPWEGWWEGLLVITVLERVWCCSLVGTLMPRAFWLMPLAKSEALYLKSKAKPQIMLSQVCHMQSQVFPLISIRLVWNRICSIATFLHKSYFSHLCFLHILQDNAHCSSKETIIIKISRKKRQNLQLQPLLCKYYQPPFPQKKIIWKNQKTKGPGRML